MVDFLNEFTTWLLYFFIYSIIGWVFESTYCSLKSKPMHFINRGFLFGPVCPIYGAGIVAVAFILYPLNLEWWQQFFAIIIICDTIEYFTSLIMEKLYHVRWWSYKNSWYNITLNGRISLMTSIGFGLGGLFVMQLIHPDVVNFVGGLTFGAKMALSVSCSVIFMMDNYMSHKAASSVKHALKGGHIDLTDEIKRYAFNYYRKQTRKTRKLARALLRRMKKAQKSAIKQLKRTQKQIIKSAKKAKSYSIARQKRIEARLTTKRKKVENKIDYKTTRHEVKKEIAHTNIQSIPRKTERMRKNSKVDLSKK